ncbi:MAG: alkaline phosphatase [Candidatus Hydrogenedentes bacterium]|nr:alkaline phosphatase [Candidatus Hydrogenedentota bacterium]
MRKFFYICWALLCGAACLSAQAQPASVEHVMIIGVDGLGPAGIEGTQSPVLHALMQQGAHTFHARGVMPTSSSPNWASMIMGAGPEQHGVTSNEWEPEKFDIAPSTSGPTGIFPTVFGVLRQQRPTAKLAVVFDWDGFGRLIERGICDVFLNGNGEEDTAAKAAEVIAKERPSLLFVHFDHVDHALHESGYCTAEYFGAVEKADKLLGGLLQAVDSAGMEEKTIVLVTADHGGRQKGHGGNSMAELEIPWIIKGPGVIPGKEITAPVNTFDTAATVAYLFGIVPPEVWIGKPVRSAFAP